MTAPSSPPHPDAAVQSSTSGRSVDARGAAPDPARVDDLVAATEELAQLTLPLMWRLRSDAMHVTEAEGLRPAEALVLELVETGMRHPKELAEVLDASPPAVSSLLSDLEDRGFVARAVDPDDRRRVLLSVTDAGDAARATLREGWLELMRERLAQVALDDLRAVIRVYRNLIASTPASTESTPSAEEGSS